MIGRTARGSGRHPLEAQRSKISCINEGIHKPDRIVIGDVVIKPFRKRNRCMAVSTGDMSHSRMVLLRVVLQKVLSYTIYGVLTHSHAPADAYQCGFFGAIFDVSLAWHARCHLVERR